MSNCRERGSGFGVHMPNCTSHPDYYSSGLGYDPTAITDLGRRPTMSGQFKVTQRVVNVPRNAAGVPVISEVFGFSAMGSRIGSDPDWIVEHSQHVHNTSLKLLHLPTGFEINIELPPAVAAAADAQRQQRRKEMFIATPEGTSVNWTHDSEEEEVEPVHNHDGEIDF